MSDFLSLFDAYSLRARVYPALLTLLPAILMGLGLFQYSIESWKSLLPFFLSFGAIYMLADIARSLGKVLESRLLSVWGGWPTTIWLRHGSNFLTDGERNRYHLFLAAQEGIGPMPTAKDENIDLKSADGKYASAASWLRARCRGDKFPMVEKELANYGFRRNLLGLKPVALVILAIVFLSPGAVAISQLDGDFSNCLQSIVNAYSDMTAQTMGALAFGLIMLTIWIFLIKQNWVRVGADQYARALLSCCDTLSANSG